MCQRLVQLKRMKQEKMKQNDLEIKNKKANLNYFIEETYEAGMSLLGWEFKSILAKKVNLDNAYVVLNSGEAFLLNAQMAVPDSASTHVECNPLRTRKLLLHRAELSKLIGAVQQKGYTLIPLKIYIKRGKAKLLFGLGRGKKNYDKREDLKQKDVQREIQQAIKRSR